MESNKIDGPLVDPPSDYNAVKCVSEELMKLSFDERQALEEEIHGVRCGSVEETPKLLTQSLEEFDEKINARKENHPVLRNIERTVPKAPVSTERVSSETTYKCYLNDPDTRLIFLRVVSFDVDRAVDRFINFFEFMTELFGDYVADRPVRITDFKPGRETKALQNSRSQFLPFRDRSGRRVLCGVGTCDMNLGLLRFKIIMFLSWSVVYNDVETQQKGVVVLHWCCNELNNDTTWEKSLRPSMTASIRKLQKRQNKSLPIRMVSIHQYLRDTPFFRALAALYSFGLGPYEHSIYRAHFGDHFELLYKMSSFGIQTDLLPLSHTSTVKLQNHSLFLKVLRAKLAHETSTDPVKEEIVECPSSYDVIFRKGPTQRKNVGNEFYRELIESYSEAHMRQTSKKAKRAITTNIVKAIEDRNGRFLEWSKDEMWIVVTHAEIKRHKVACAMKQYNRLARNKIAMENALHSASNIAEEDPGPESSKATAKFDPISQTQRFRQYYSKEYQSIKRRRIFGQECHDKKTDGACFGKIFFPCH